MPGIDQKIAALLGTDAREIQINDLAISPVSKNAFISVSRGRGSTAMPVLLRVDGAGDIDVISLTDVSYTAAALPNAPEANPGARRNREPPRSPTWPMSTAGCSSRAFKRGVFVKAAVRHLPVQRG